MVISVNGHPLALKKGSSFEYISENRLFSGSDAYTLSITFPLRDCPQNLKVFGNINRKDVSLGKIIFDCEIRDKSFYKFGTLTAVEISESEVKCQFLEGRSEQNFDKTFDDIYINELNLGAPTSVKPGYISAYNAINPDYMENKYVALPWVNNNEESAESCNFMKEGSNGYFSWVDSQSNLSWQPYLVFILEGLAMALNYDLDIETLKNNNASKYLLICNTLPPEWEVPEFARALPHWSVKEFFEKLEWFLNGEFSFDHRNRKISFCFISSVLKNKLPVYLKNIVDESSVEISADSADCNYKESLNLTYKDEEDSQWKFLSCNWYLEYYKDKIKKYDSLKDIIDNLKELATKWEYSSSVAGSYDRLSDIYYAADVDTYFIVMSEGWGSSNGDDDFGQLRRLNKCYLQPINIFGERIMDRDEDAKVEELEILPVQINKTEDIYGVCAFLKPGSTEKSEVDAPLNPQLENILHGNTVSQTNLLNGEKDSRFPEYYDKIYMGWWNGKKNPDSPMPYPFTDPVVVFKDWSGYEIIDCFNMRLNGRDSSHRPMFHIDSMVKKNFKFLSDNIPDPRAVFFIHGKRYICEKITATFTESGMSQLLKGEFYPLID